MLTAQAAVELDERGIRVNPVALGAIDVEGDERSAARAPPGYRGRPLRRAGAPEEVASVVAVLASTEASDVTGAVWSVDGGALVRHSW